ncbi:MAG: hypothetical protein AAF730_01570 [Bacteroidota bacterium]
MNDDYTELAFKLMQLTRDGKLEWQIEAHEGLGERLMARIGTMTFVLEPIEARQSRVVIHGRPQFPPRVEYYLVANDEQEDKEPVVSPPFSAGIALANVAKSHGRRQRVHDIRTKLDQFITSD